MQFNLFDSERNAILNASDYESFRKALSEYDCRSCELASGRTKIVIDRGNPESRILVIGERPGDNEDREGKAFIGRAGELLDRIMESIGLDTNKDMLIANVAKCRPPSDRAPTATEARTCLPFLQKQIDLIKPRVILLLGAVALRYLVREGDDFSMESEAGKFFTREEYPGVQFMVLYHPAFLLRDPRKKRVMWDHVKKLREFLEEIA